jgi:two-component sensor histidine kinase
MPTVHRPCVNVMNFLTNLFSSNSFMPHGHCYFWNTSLVRLHVISDSMIALAYLTIPVTLIYIARKRKDIPFDWMLACFSIFILACGATHALEVWTLWIPTYWLSGTVKAITAAASVATAMLLVKLVPQFLAIPNPRDLRQAIASLHKEAAERRQAEEKLRESNARLESRVDERTNQLRAANAELQLQISERSRTEISLEEKEVLLREIHHRVKNNLQVITSLLQLQSGYLRDPEDAAMFKDCQARIHAMALVHDRLYRSGNLGTIDFSEHVRELIALIIRGQSVAADGIRLVVESEPIEVNLDVAIPLGLITAELITNAFKHAFRDRPGGVITVRLARTEERQITLTVEDDGGGLPGGFDPEKARSLGLRLIRALSRQLRGELSIVSSTSGSKLAVSLAI